MLGHTARTVLCVGARRLRSRKVLGTRGAHTLAMTNQETAFFTVSDRAPLWPIRGVAALCSVVVDGAYELTTGDGLVVEVGTAARVFGAAELRYGGAPMLHARALGHVTLRLADVGTLMTAPASEPSAESMLDEALRLERAALCLALSVQRLDALGRMVRLLRAYALARSVSRDDGWRKLRIARTHQDLGDSCALTVRHTSRVLRELSVRGLFRQEKGWSFVHERLISEAAIGFAPVSVSEALVQP